jgi:hypothetical protein
MFMWLAVYVHGGDEKCTQSLGQITWKEESVWKDNIKIDYVDVGCEVVSGLG